jgi:hypothetical protein
LRVLELGGAKRQLIHQYETERAELLLTGSGNTSERKVDPETPPPGNSFGEDTTQEWANN